MSTVLVIGANSFAASDLIDLLLTTTDHNVIGISRSAPRPVPFLYRPLTTDQHRRYVCYRMDLNKIMRMVCEVIDGVRPEYVVNFAAQSEVAPSWDHPEQWFQTNVAALAALVNHLRQRTYLKRFVQVSSPEVYGDCTGLEIKECAPMRPSTPYAASKAAADMLLAVYHKQFGFPVLTTRATNYFGARQQLHKLIPRALICMKKGERIKLHGGGKAVKSWLHVRDASRGVLAVLERGRIGECYHLAPDRGAAVCDVVQRLAAFSGKTLLDVADVAPERIGQDAAYVINSGKARGELGWLPQVSLDDGVMETHLWVEQNWPALSALPVEYQHKA
jgi:dTDP-glucose 4,6-dehydratase